MRSFNQLCEKENFEEAYDVISNYIREYDQKNPFYIYSRAKCGFNMGAKYLNAGRSDLIECLSLISKSNSENNIILEIKAHYVSGLYEVEFGTDLKRAEYHFDLVLFLSKNLPTSLYKQNVEWIKEFAKNIDNYKHKIKSGDLKSSQSCESIDLKQEAADFKDLWSQFEFQKMDIREKSEWFVLSSEWLNKWKEYVDYEGTDEAEDSSMQCTHPGMITNEDIIDEVEDLLFDYKRGHLNVNLKENLREEDHYQIIDEKLWKFLRIRYGGIEIKRFGVKREDNSDECIIEVNLLKLNIHYFPSQQDEDVNLYTIYESRYSTVEQLKERLAELKRKYSMDIKLWKAPKPSDFEAFYRNNLCEFRQHREIRLDAEYLKKRFAKIGEVHFSMDDFIIVECKCQGRFIFEEIDKPDSESNLDDNMDLEESKDELNDPKTLAFLNLDIGQILKKNSNAGLSGLSNLGNTCFMNSALQCLSNTTELTKYFLFGLYKNEINYTNPLGTKGRLATAYAKLMKELWITNDSRVAPWDVKKAIGTVAYQFQGFAQQDSFELFNYVADTLHEDLNRVKDKPITEFKDSNGRPDAEVSADHWSAFADRNQSVIVDLMYGQLKSRLICCVCENISNTFDPYLALSLPIPKSKKQKLPITYFPCDLDNGHCVKKFKLGVEYSDSVRDIKNKIKEAMGTENRILLYNLRRRNQLDGKLDNDVKASKLENERLVAYEYKVDFEKQNCAIIPVILTKESRSMFGSSSYDEICEPKVFCFNIENSCTDLKRTIFRYFFPHLKLPEQYKETYDKSVNKEKCINQIYDKFYLESDYGVKILIIEFEKEKSNYASLRKFSPFEDSDTKLSSFIEKLDCNEEFILRVHFPSNAKVSLDALEASDSYEKESGSISIEDCLERFRVEELLKDDNKYHYENDLLYYCSKCKEHQETFKKMDIYRLPKVLVIQLKRFSKDSSSKYGGIHRMMGSSKNSDLVDFPIEGLDMGKYILEKEEGKEYIYDLYAISNHMGSLYGGHYTAHCKNTVTNKWYYFNDSSCGPTQESHLVESSAYVLFYRLRE